MATSQSGYDDRHRESRAYGSLCPIRNIRLWNRIPNMKLLRKLQNSYRRSGLPGTIAVCARSLWFYAKELTPSRRRGRQRDRERQAEFDRRFGVKTGGDINLADLAILPTWSRAFGVGYAPTPELLFAQMLSAVPANFRDFVFVDFGSGMGRVLLLASEYPFRAIRGVEFSPELHSVACENIRSYRSLTQKCTDITSTCQDAAEYIIPDERALFYFYNPFMEPVMARVMQNIEHSLQRNPREAYLIYYNPAARKVVDRSTVFRATAKSATYCVYRSLEGDPQSENPVSGATGAYARPAGNVRS